MCRQKVDRNYKTKGEEKGTHVVRILRHWLLLRFTAIIKTFFLICKVNDRDGNSDLTSFVFKTSGEQMKIALNMYREGDHFMRDEHCYLDGKV